MRSIVLPGASSGVNSSPLSQENKKSKKAEKKIWDNFIAFKFSIYNLNTTSRKYPTKNSIKIRVFSINRFEENDQDAIHCSVYCLLDP